MLTNVNALPGSISVRVTFAPVQLFSLVRRSIDTWLPAHVVNIIKDNSSVVDVICGDEHPYMPSTSALFFYIQIVSAADGVCSLARATG